MRMFCLFGPRGTLRSSALPGIVGTLEHSDPTSILDLWNIQNIFRLKCFYIFDFVLWQATTEVRLGSELFVTKPPTEQTGLQAAHH